MKYLLLICLFIFVSCQGKLTEEQKRKIREEREQSQIKKISEADITEAAFAYGRTITGILEKRDKTLTNKKLIDSLQSTFTVEIISMRADDPTLHEVEKKVIEAYASAGNGDGLTDNIQKMGKDSILYTKPLIRELSNGTKEFTNAIGLRIAKRQIIRTIK
jgi:hypothetical protein